MRTKRQGGEVTMWEMLSAELDDARLLVKPWIGAIDLYLAI
jgi:hypothetical protein